MGKLDWYIARQVLAAMLLVLLVLGGLDLLFTAVDELGETEGGYGTVAAFRFVLFTTPRHLYELLPATALIGALAGLGSLAASNELVGMQAAGYSRWRITRAVMQPAVIVMLLGLLLGEYLAPRLELRAEVDKSQARGQSVGLSRYGHWERDGNMFLHFNSVETYGVLYGVTVFEFDDEQRLLRQVAADAAVYRGSTNSADNTGI
ncbi:MAG: LptF/LptG family permease, partial [Pseudomonadota bacterium]